MEEPTPGATDRLAELGAPGRAAGRPRRAPQACWRRCAEPCIGMLSQGDLLDSAAAQDRCFRPKQKPLLRSAASGIAPILRGRRSMRAAEREFLRMATAVGPAYRRSKQGEFNHSGGNG